MFAILITDNPHPRRLEKVFVKIRGRRIHSFTADSHATKKQKSQWFKKYILLNGCYYIFITVIIAAALSWFWQEKIQFISSERVSILKRKNCTFFNSDKNSANFAFWCETCEPKLFQFMKQILTDLMAITTLLLFDQFQVLFIGT